VPQQKNMLRDRLVPRHGTYWRILQSKLEEAMADFAKLKVWQAAHEFALCAYRLTSAHRTSSNQAQQLISFRPSVFRLPPAVTAPSES
jgi:hypothetical protein